MTLWISNFVAYSVQLTVLVGAAAGVAALLRIHRPVAALRFWQGVFAVALLWPACQVWGHGGAAANTPAGRVFTSVADWSLSTSVAQSAVSNPAYAWMIVTIVTLTVRDGRIEHIDALVDPAKLAPIAKALGTRQQSRS